MDRERLFGDAKASAKAGDTQRKQKALAAAEAAYQNEPSPRTQHAYANALLDAGRFEESEQLLRDLLKQQGDDIQIICDLAFVCKSQAKTEQAIELFKRVIELNSRHSLARCAENELWLLDPNYRPSWLRAGGSE